MDLIPHPRWRSSAPKEALPQASGQIFCPPLFQAQTSPSVSRSTCGLGTCVLGLTSRRTWASRRPISQLVTICHGPLTVPRFKLRMCSLNLATLTNTTRRFKDLSSYSCTGDQSPTWDYSHTLAAYKWDTCSLTSQPALSARHTSTSGGARRFRLRQSDRQDPVPKNPRHRLGCHTAGCLPTRGPPKPNAHLALVVLVSIRAFLFY